MVDCCLALIFALAAEGRRLGRAGSGCVCWCTAGVNNTPELCSRSFSPRLSVGSALGTLNDPVSAFATMSVTSFFGSALLGISSTLGVISVGSNLSDVEDEVGSNGGLPAVDSRVSCVFDESCDRGTFAPPTLGRRNCRCTAKGVSTDHARLSESLSPFPTVCFTRAALNSRVPALAVFGEMLAPPMLRKGLMVTSHLRRTELMPMLNIGSVMLQYSELAVCGIGGRTKAQIVGRETGVYRISGQYSAKKINKAG